MKARNKFTLDHLLLIHKKLALISALNSLTDLLDIECRRNAPNLQTLKICPLWLISLFSKRNHRFTVVFPFVYFCYFPFRAKKEKAVREEKTAEYHVTERLSLATPLTSAYRAPLEQFATILPRVLYNSVMAALGCRLLLLEKATWPITQADNVWIS